MRTKLDLFLIATLLNVTVTYAQTLQESVEEVLVTNPIILERLKNYNSTREDIEDAKSGYYPKLDLTLGAGFEDTDRKKVPSTPDTQYDNDVYEASIKYTQNLFNGFKTTYYLSQQEHRAASSAYSYIEKVNDTVFTFTDSYLQMMKNAELVANSKENVEINDEIFQKVQKLFDAGLTTLSEVNKVESSLALAKSNFVVQENTLLDNAYSLEKKLGRALNIDNMKLPTIKTELPTTLKEAQKFAVENNPSLIISDYNIKLAQEKYKEKKSTSYPRVDLEVSESWRKDQGSEGENTEFKAMVYLRYNIFNGFADSSAQQKTISELHKEFQILNTLKRDVIEGLNLSWVAKEKITEQLMHLKKYNEFSKKTLVLYTKEYDLGQRSLLDLLSAQNDFIASKAQIINAKYSILFAKYRVLDAMGTLVLEIVGDTKSIYSKVNLVGDERTKQDALPIFFDEDRDLVVDRADICSNSLIDKLRDIYGCAIVDERIEQIERYGDFFFGDDSSNITTSTSQRLNELVEQLKPYGLQNIEIDLLSHVDNESLTEQEIATITKERSTNIKDALIEAGFSNQSIRIHNIGNSANMFSNETSEGKRLNNRVDIVVNKLKR